MYTPSLKPVQLPYAVRLLVVLSLLVSSLGWGESLLRQPSFGPAHAFTAGTPSQTVKLAAEGADRPQASDKVVSDRAEQLGQPQTSAGNHPTMEDSASLPAGLYAAWLAQQQAEGGVAYSLVKGRDEGPGDWTGSNPAQGLHLEFQQDVVKVNGWGIELNTSSLPQVAGNRIEYQEANGLREWYVNGPLGLEQGFTLTKPLPQTDQDGWLALTVPFEGASVQTQGQSKEWLGLVGANGQQVGQYGKLYATDAHGKVLDSQLGPSEDGRAAILKVKVATASYPLEIDPFVQQARLTANDGTANDAFGISVALSSDDSTALIGAFYKTIGANNVQGAAYIFTRSGVGGSYSQSQRLTNSDGAAYDEFGTSVALSSDGSTALIGAYNKNIGANTQQGAAYIFTKSGGSYSQSQRLTAADGTVSDQFGRSLALSSDGSTALIGAFSKNIGANNGQGAAYIFTRSGVGGSYSQSQRLTNSDGATGDQFGNSVALSSDGSTALIGTNNKTIGANNGQGAAYIFTRSGVGGSYSQSQRLTNSDGVAGDAFGNSVTLSSDGSTALISAFYKTIGANSQQGAAYIFTRSGVGGSYSQSQRLTASDGASGDEFGISVALSSDGLTALIGVFYKTIGANNVQGAAYIFTRSGVGGSYSQSQRLTNADGAAGDIFGASVALSSDGATALIGALGKTIGANGNQGAAYIFAVPTASVTVDSGSGQSAPVNTAFTSPLVALVRDSSTNNPLPGLSVTFTAPGSGAGGTFAGGSTVYTASTDASGLVTTTTFTANSVVGSYSVTATVVGGGGNSTSFSLTNLPPCTPLVVTSNLDDGSCGTLRYAVLSVASPLTSKAKIITVDLSAGSVITLTTGLTLTSGVAITTTAPCGVGAGNTMLPPVILQGVGSSSGVGLTLSGHNSLYGLWVRGFSGVQIKAPVGSHTLMQCVRASKL